MSGTATALRGLGRALTWPLRATASASRSQPMAVLGALAVVVVLLGVLSGFIYQRQHDYDAAEQRRHVVLNTAKKQVEALLSYRPGTVEQELRTERQALTGEFRDTYSLLVKRFVVPLAKKRQITSKTEIVAASVTSAEPGRAEVLLFVERRISTAGATNPQRSVEGVTVTLVRVNGRWLISALDRV